MSFIGKNGFFGALTPADPHYARYALDPAYAKFVDHYSRGGGSMNGTGTLGKAFAYTRPRFDDGGGVDFSDPVFNQPQQQPRQPGQVEGMLRAQQQWGQGIGGVSQRFANPGLYDIQIASDSLQRSVDSDTADKIQKYTDKISKKVAAADPDVDTPGLVKRAQGGNVAQWPERTSRKYRKPPPNNPNNDSGSTYQAARGAGDYSFGKKTSRNNYATQIEPTGHNNVKRRSGMTEDYLRPAQRRAYERDNRFAKGGAAKMTPAWKDRPYPVTQRTQKGVKINAPHSGEGLVMNIHLSDVGPHAISFQSGPEGYNGRVNTERMAARGLQSDAHPQQFHRRTVIG